MRNIAFATVPLIIFGFIILIVAYLISLYNSLVKKRNNVDNAWAQVKVQLKRRWDLIPNLVETVKGYAAYESETLEAVVAARNAAMSSGGDVAAQAAAENNLSATLRSLFAVAEAYPDLKANEGFLNLQNELTATEDKISYARQFFNDTTTIYNNAIQLFPAVLIAGLLGFTPRDLFDISDSESEPVAVKF